MSEGKSRERKHEYLSALSVKVGRMISFEGVAIELIEVNKSEIPFAPTQYVITYRMIDNRVAPPFITDKAHLFVTPDVNLIDEFRKVRQHYEDIKSSLRLKP